jgi:hypothetical protein
MGRALGYAVGDCGSGLVPRERKKLWVFSRTALWYTTRVPPVAPRHVLVVDLDGKLRMETFFCTDLQATPMEILDASQSLCRYTLSKRPKVELNGQRLLFPNFHLDLP